MEEVEITHFSHEHSLILIKQAIPPSVEEKRDDENICICYGCKETVLMSEEEAYKCEVRGCETIFLHKQCAQLPREIMHSSHDQHSLILLASSPYEAHRGLCDVCRERLDGFNYYCSVCEFNLDVKCVLKEKEALFVYINKKFKHPSHEHLLIYQPRIASFHCNVCKLESKDLSYQCENYGCPFWIHKTCGLLQNITERNDHDHPLQLIYKLPSEYLNFRYFCAVCGEQIWPMDWTYYCRPCRYFVHIKCIKSPKLQIGNDHLYNDDDATFEDRMFKLLLPVDFLHFPVVDESVGHRFELHHRLQLSFPPYPDHPDPFDCFECEVEADPNFWLYRCKECDLSFHPYCADNRDADIMVGYNMKFGQNLKIDSHIHPLKYVRKASVNSPCHDCGLDIPKDDPFAVECETCNFHLCDTCIWRIDI